MVPENDSTMTPEERQEARARLLQWQKDRLEEVGWYAHFTFDNETGAADHHTHGLSDTHAHKDFQIKLNTSIETISFVLEAVVSLLKKGRIFKDGDTSNEVIQNFDVKFVKVYRDGVPYLRIILPDPQGNLEKEHMEPAYAAQYL